MMLVDRIKASATALPSIVAAETLGYITTTFGRTCAVFVTAGIFGITVRITAQITVERTTTWRCA